MGGMNFGPGALADCLSETAGYKAGLALSVDEICDHLAGTEYPDIVRSSEKFGTRLRSEEYEELFYKLLHRIGYTKDEYGGAAQAQGKRFHKYRKSGLLKELEGVAEIFSSMWMELMDRARATGSKSIDPSPFLQRCYDEFGQVGFDMGVEQLEILNASVFLNPHSIGRAVEWVDVLALQKLFAGSTDHAAHGKFIDQRYVDYLSRNTNRLSEMHWRKFEELTAEFFHRSGYKVDLGPGSNDDGVDVRVWRENAISSDSPLCIVQCKRQKEKIGRVIVKGLYADVKHEGAEFGVVVTTSELSPAAKNTIIARGYPIQAVEREGVSKWLTALRSPGTGIVRLR